MSIKVLGARVLVKPFKLEEVDDVYKKVKAAGLHVPDLDEKKREQAGIDEGTLVSIGVLAWKEWGDGSPWAKVGDRVMWAKHAGKTVKYDEKSGERLVIVNDDDLICKVDK